MTCIYCNDDPTVSENCYCRGVRDPLTPEQYKKLWAKIELNGRYGKMVGDVVDYPPAPDEQAALLKEVRERTQDVVKWLHAAVLTGTASHWTLFKARLFGRRMTGFDGLHECVGYVYKGKLYLYDFKERKK